MKGLIIKDLLNLKKQLKIILVIVVFYVVIGFSSDDSSLLTSITVLLFAMMPITSIAYDDLAKWDKYALSLPISRRELVSSKYILSLIFSIAGALVSLLIGALISVVTGNISILRQLEISYSLFAVAIVFCGIMFPLIYRFGVEKSRIMMFGVVGIPVATIVILARLGYPAPTDAQFSIFLKVSPFLLALFFFLSYRISCKIFTRKDF